MQDPRIVSKYVDILTKHIKYHRIDVQVQSLYNMAHEGRWTTPCTIAYEKLDTLMTEGMLHAEREVSRKFSRGYHWS